MKGRIFDIQRCSLHDGPGIRTTVFLQGCPLRCAWCHNPEGCGPRPILGFLCDRCAVCGACIVACPHGVHRVEPQPAGHTLERVRCRACGHCAVACPADALELVGREAGVAEVLQIVVRDAPFYAASGGGLTLSGGEPMAQVGFSAALLAAARAAGVHTAVETCGHATWASYARVLGVVDLFLFDLKETDAARHRALTGVDNVLILANLRRLHAAGARVRLRLPLVPGANARSEHLAAVAALARELPGLVGVDVMPYHAYGRGKQARFGIEGDPAAAFPVPDAATVRGWIEQLRNLGVANVSASAT